MKILSWSVLSIIMPLFPLFAGPAEEAWEAYLAGDFETVEAIVTESISDTSISIKAHARLYLALGCSDAMRNRERTAAAAFEQALILDPTIKLTADDIPPPVWRVFKPVWERSRKVERSILTLPDTTAAVKPVKTAPDTVTRYIGVTHSASATLKSLVFPGWGHYAEGRPQWRVFAASEAGLAAGWLTCLYLADAARNEYLQAENPDEISSRYDRYNNMRRLSWGLGAAAVVNYLFIQWRFFSEPPPVDPQVGLVDPSKPQLTLSWRF